MNQLSTKQLKCYKQDLNYRVETVFVTVLITQILTDGPCKPILRF